MTTIHQLEAWSTSLATLSPERAEAVAGSGLVDVRIESPPDQWRLVADSHVGVVHGGDWELRVVPRLAIPKLMFLLAYAADPKGWRELGPSFEAEDQLFASVASGFAVHAERALTPVPIRGYRSIEDRATTLRGRLRVADQIVRWPALPIPLEVEYDDYTEDVPENRMLRGATEHLLRMPLVPAVARKRLLRVRATLEGVAPTPPSAEVKAPVMTRLNGRYQSALALAELVLRGCSISSRSGDVASIAFVFDLNTVFEDFLSTTLRAALERRNGTVQLQHDRRHLDEERKIRLKPDITWWQRGDCQAVIDAKYKPLGDTRFPNDDAYQMLAYCTAFDLPRGYLVYAKDAGLGKRTHRIVGAGVTLDISAVDVEQAPDTVLGQVDELAKRIAVERDQAGLASVAA